MVHMVVLDIRDHCDMGHQLQERAVALIRLRHQIFAASEPRVAVRQVIDLPADDNGRVDAAMFENQADHRSRRSLSVGSGDGNAFRRVQERRVDVRTVQYLNSLRFRRCDFHIVLWNRGGNDYCVCAFHMRRVVPFEYLGATLRKLLRSRRHFLIRPRNLISFVQQYARQRAHTGAADADEMDFADSLKH